MSHEVFATLRCELCGERIAGPNTIVTPGQNYTPRLIQFLTEINEHLARKHEDKCAEIDAAAMQYKGLLLLMQYTTSDPRIRLQRNVLRWEVHQMTLDARLPDEKIDAQSAMIAFSILEEIRARDLAMVQNGAESDLSMHEAAVREMIARHISNVVKGLRDLLEEPTRPTIPANLQVVQAP